MSKLLHVLIVGNSECDADLLLQELKQAGYNSLLEQIDTEKKMRAALQEQVRDIILYDYNLPSFSVWEALTVLKESGRDIPFIVLSSLAEEEVIVDCMRAGASDFILKSKPARLALVIERELKEKEKREARKELEDSLKKSEARLRRIMDSDIIGITYWKSDGEIEQANNAFLDMVGYTRNDLENGVVNWRKMTPPESESVDEQAWEQLRIIGTCKPFEKQFIRKDGNRVDVLIVVACLEHTLEEGVAVFLDISERKQAEQALAESEERFREELERAVTERTFQLEAANKELEAFSYSVSHDLRSPLRAVDGFSRALLDDYAHKLDTQGIYYLTRVRQNSQKMGKLIDDILQLARLTRQDMMVEPVDLSVMAKSIASELYEQDSTRQVTFIIADGMTTQGDKRLLHAVLQNLFENAWKYTSKHPTARIEFGTLTYNGQLAYFVKDDGVGFEMKYAGKLFEAFQRLHGADEFPGTGIGLATVARIIHRHSGHVWAEAEIEKGATFYFTLDLP